MSSRFDPDFWKANAWIVDGAPGTGVNDVPSDFVSFGAGGDEFSFYGHIKGPGSWIRQSSEGMGDVTFSYKDGILYDGVQRTNWPAAPALEFTFEDFIENEASELEDAGATIDGIKGAANDGSMNQVLDEWAKKRANGTIGFNQQTVSQEPQSAISFLTDTPLWEGQGISKDARLAATLYNKYARTLEVELLHSLAPTKSSIEAAVDRDSALTASPADFSDEEKIWVYQYLFGAIKYTSSGTLVIPDYIPSDDIDFLDPPGLHRGKSRCAVAIYDAVLERYGDEVASDQSRLRDKAREEMAMDPGVYEERVFNDQCWLLTNMQWLHIKSVRGLSGRSLTGLSKGGPGGGSLAPGQIAVDSDGQPVDATPTRVGQANIPKHWATGADQPERYPDGSIKFDLGWPYRNFTVLRGNPHTVTNTLLAKEGIEDILDITPAELSLLTPKIRFFKVFLGGARGQNRLPEAIKEVEFPFRTYSDISMLTKQKPGSGVGIESVSYTLQGSNFATAKKLVDVKARFYFRSMKDFTEKISATATVGRTKHDLELSFMDLVAYARGLGPDPAKELKVGDPSNFLLKVVLGWSLIRNPGTSAVIPSSKRRKQIRKALSKSTMVLFINATGFSYSFNDDGSMTADVTYGGYLENALDSLNLDIFGLKTAQSAYWDGENRFWEAAVKYFETVQAEKAGTESGNTTGELGGSTEKDVLSRVAHQYEVSRARLLNTVDIISQDAQTTEVNWLDMINPGDSSYARELEIGDNDLESCLREAIQKRDASLSEGRGVRWRKILDKIMNKKETDIFTAAIDTDRLSPYQKKLAFGRALDSGQRGEFANSREPVGSHFKVMTEFDETFIKTGGRTQREKAVKQVLNAVATQSTGRRKHRENPSVLLAGDPYFRQGMQGRRDTGFYRIHFIYLGDIIEAAMEVLNDAEQQDEIYPKAKLLTGDFKPHPNIYGGGLVNLADIPISMDNFLNFFVEQVVEKERDTYPLMTFIQDLIEKLVKPLLANSCDSDTGAQMDINTTYLMIKGKGEEGEYNRIPNGRISGPTRLKELLGDAGTQTPGWKKMNGYFHYIYLYADTVLSSNFKEKKSQDHKRKVYHLALGRDRGIVKNAVFKKRDVRGLEEARAFSERGASVTDNILIPYHDVDVKLVGNTIFWPGMLFYLDPAFAGLGTKTTRRRISQELNIGGYYRVIRVDGTISRDGFESTIDGTYVFNPLQRRSAEQRQLQNELDAYTDEAVDEELN